MATRSLRPPRPPLVALVLLLVALAPLLLVAPASAAVGPAPGPLSQVAGGCTATIAGQDVSAARSVRSAIEVDADATIVAAGTAPGPISGYEVALSFGGISFPAADGEVTDGSTSYSTEVNVSDYARYGVGIYRVEASTSGTPCSTWAYVKVTGKSPLTTPAGAVGALLAIGGLIGMISAALGRGSDAAAATAGGPGVAT